MILSSITCNLDKAFGKKMERIGKLTENLAKLVQDITNYRETTSADGQTYKRFVDTVADGTEGRRTAES